MPDADVRAMLGRRPAKGKEAFGHVDLDAKARSGLAQIIRNLRNRCEGSGEVAFHPEDRAEEGEVLAGPLAGFDAHYQPKAPWSLERTVTATRAVGIPATLGKVEIEEGGWTFYALRLLEDGIDTVLVRGRSPTYGLGSSNKLITMFRGTELHPVDEPLIGFDFGGDLLVVGEKVYVIDPERAETLLVDAEAVKARAAQTAARFVSAMQASLTASTTESIEALCSRNATVARRAERLVREGALRGVSAAGIRAGSPDAGLPKDAFGSSGRLRAETEVMAKFLIEIAADLYYQPRFAGPSRRVGSYRNVKK
jgi:hypothetical protein